MTSASATAAGPQHARTIAAVIPATPAGVAGMTAAVVLACCGPAAVAEADVMPGTRPPAVTARAAATSRAGRLILLVPKEFVPFCWPWVGVAQGGIAVSRV